MKLEKKQKTRFGAPAGKKIVCFVDDVNMPLRETYFAQPPIELLRQFQDFKGFYDRQLLFWKDIEDMTIVTACAPPGGGRNEVGLSFASIKILKKIVMWMIVRMTINKSILRRSYMRQLS